MMMSVSNVGVFYSVLVCVCVSPQWFRSAVIKENAMPEGLMNLLFSNIDPIYEFHRGFLKEIDQRLALWYPSPLSYLDQSWTKDIF